MSQAIHEHEQIRYIQELMKDFPHPWFLAGGWSLDLAAGVVCREHEDIDICIFREHTAAALQYFADWEIGVAIPGEHRLEPVHSVEDTLAPRFGLHLRRGEEFVEILLTDRTGEHGEEIPFRRDPSITIPSKRFAQVDAHGLPYTAPEWLLLFKAKEGREKDEADFFLHAPNLDAKSQRWLLAALEKHQPQSPWIAKLRDMIDVGK